MSVQSDKWIKKMSKNHGMIAPFEEEQVRGNKISFGTSSYGYDARVNSEFKIFSSPSKPNPSFPANPIKVAACSPSG